MTVIRVTVVEALGSTPRGVGASMIVGPDGIQGSIGGGALEYRAMEVAAEMLAEGTEEATLRLPLGPMLKQCCGGYVVLRLEATEDEALPAEEAREELFLYGAGHVGRAVVRALEDLPFALAWADPRPSTFPEDAERRARVVAGDPLPVAEAAPPSSYHVIMTHDHGLDLALCGVLLPRPDLAYVGLIGSRSKKARFHRQLAAQGVPDAAFARLVCPIGVTGILGKEPAVIAAGTVAELLLVRSRRLRSAKGSSRAASA